MLMHWGENNYHRSTERLHWRYLKPDYMCNECENHFSYLGFHRWFGARWTSLPLFSPTFLQHLQIAFCDLLDGTPQKFSPFLSAITTSVQMDLCSQFSFQRESAKHPVQLDAATWQVFSPVTGPHRLQHSHLQRWLQKPQNANSLSHSVKCFFSQVPKNTTLTDSLRYRDAALTCYSYSNWPSAPRCRRGPPWKQTKELLLVLIQLPQNSFASLRH